MNPVIQLHARARRILTDLERVGIVPDLRDGVVYFIGNYERIPAELRIELDVLHSEIENYLLTIPTTGGLRNAR